MHSLKLVEQPLQSFARSVITFLCARGEPVRRKENVTALGGIKNEFKVLYSAYSVNTVLARY